MRNFRGTHRIPVYREDEREERQELILTEAANRLGVCNMTVVRLIREGLLSADRSALAPPMSFARVTWMLRPSDRRSPGDVQYHPIRDKKVFLFNEIMRYCIMSPSC